MKENSQTILIVDDSAIVLIRLLRLLEGMDKNISMLQAGNYHDAYYLLIEKKPDIILLDVNLPDKSGIELLRYIKKDHPSIFVIMLSNQSSIHYRTVCRFIGADHFIDKSTEFEQIPILLAAI